MCISTKIKEIVRLRAQHLPQIKAKREHLLQVESQLNELDNLLSKIRIEIEQQQGDYYAIIQENPKMAQAIKAVSTEHVRKKIKEQQKKLEILEKRFAREAVRIAMIGYERQGKSTFLKAISGLKSDKVIPAYSGTSCTGAVSIIHNIEGPFRVEIEMYNLQEFLAIVKEKLSKFFPGRTFYINNVSDLQTIDLSGYTSSDITLNSEFDKFKRAYCEHVNDYSMLLGRPTLVLTNEDEVVKHVAQYERFDIQPEGGYDEIVPPEEVGEPERYQRNYYKYVAVKHVNIYKKFECIESRQIELVDTVGLGDASDADKIEKEMFRVLCEDCDAAVDLFKPQANGDSFNKPQQDILKKIKLQLKGRTPDKWIVYVINKVQKGKGYNAGVVNSILTQFEGAIAPMATDGEKPVAWGRIIDGGDVNDVQQNLVIPLLELITTNLPVLDGNLMKDAQKTGTEVYDAYYQLRENVEKVISGAAKKGTQEGALFDKKMEELTRCLFPSLRKLDEDKYQKQRAKPCPEIAQTLEAVIDGLYDVVPDEEDIAKDVDMGAKGAVGIFADYCNTFHNRIFTEFENVSEEVIIPLRETVKMDMIRLMYQTALLGRVPLRNYSINEGPSIKWLECLLNEKVRQDTYPDFYDALNYILTYQFNIEDTIEYDVSQSIGIIDQLNVEEYIPYKGQLGGSVSERANAIWQELCNRVSPLQQKLRKTINRFALIPSHSFSTRVQKFRFKIVWGKEVSDDMREFYRDNCYAIWDDFGLIEGKAAAFGKWNQICQGIAALCNREQFVLEI